MYSHRIPPLEVNPILGKIQRKLSQLLIKETDSKPPQQTSEEPPKKPSSRAPIQTNGSTPTATKEAPQPPRESPRRRRRRRPKSPRPRPQSLEAPPSNGDRPFEEASTPAPVASVAPIDPALLEKDGLFGDIPVPGHVAQALKQMQYNTPTPIQEAVIPLVRQGLDLVGQAQTGTGKTAAFGIPLVESLDPSSRKSQALVLVPTRELAQQVQKELVRLGWFSNIRAVAIYGGQAMNPQLSALEKGGHILVATPGRLMDHMQRRTVSLEDIRVVVLDEADQMLDIGFADDIRRILRATPPSHQTLLFSATMPGPIRSLALRFLKNPQWIRVGGDAEPVDGVDQVYYEVSERDRPEVLDKLLQKPDRITQALIFRRTKIGVDRLMAYLKSRHHDVQAIHGDMTQAQRNFVMERFRAHRLRILVATNVAARGLDIPAVSHVINYDMPDNLEEYVHRIGRTARMGRHGTAITFVSEWGFPMLDIIQAHVGEDLHEERLVPSKD